jgi:hypothetical protein
MDLSFLRISPVVEMRSCQLGAQGKAIRLPIKKKIRFFFLTIEGQLPAIDFLKLFSHISELRAQQRRYMRPL